LTSLPFKNYTRLHPTPQIAFPGGFVDAGEKVSAAIRREFGEEALNTLELEGAERSRVEENLRTLFDSGETIYTGYVNDERNTDSAWVETTTMLFHDHDGAALSEFHLSAGDEVTSVQWTMVSRGERERRWYGEREEVHTPHLSNFNAVLSPRAATSLMSSLFRLSVMSLALSLTHHLPHCLFLSHFFSPVQVRAGQEMHASHADWLEMVAKKLDCYWDGADTGAVEALSISMSQNVVSGELCFPRKCRHAQLNSHTLTQSSPSTFFP
jgi:8-oxo-dGTP pyrophosphatase MutT (NUDIX family)